MNILFVHQNFPAQFGYIAQALKEQHGWNCVYATKWKGAYRALPFIRYRQQGGATPRVNFLARNFENTTRAALGVYRAVRDTPLRHKPDVVVGHSGFGSTAFLGELLQCPVVNLFEFFYRPSRGVNFRPEFPVEEEFQKRLHVLNATILLDLHAAAAGYTPTHFQRNQFPREYLPKIDTLFDGVDTAVFRPRAGRPRVIRGRTIPDDVKIVTYVSRGFESTRGFDIFIRVAKRIYAEYPKVLFVCVGSNRVCYGGDLRFIQEKSFREHVEKKEQPDPEKFFYTGTVPTGELAEILSLSDCHIYFTVPFVLSWSLFNAMSSGCRIVSCRVAPVEEAIIHGQSGLLADFYDVEGHARHALRILREPGEWSHLGDNARRTIEAKYDLSRTLPQFMRLLGRATGKPVH